MNPLQSAREMQFFLTNAALWLIGDDMLTERMPKWPNNPQAPARSRTSPNR
jgi:hypothetical protein